MHTRQTLYSATNKSKETLKDRLSLIERHILFLYLPERIVFYRMFETINHLTKPSFLIFLWYISITVFISFYF